MRSNQPTDRAARGRGHGASALRRAYRIAGAWLACALLAPALPAPARADERVVVTQAQLQVRHDAEASGGGYVSAQFAFDLPNALDDAIHRGIALYFVIDFELLRSRWYWFNQRLVSASLSYRLSYSPLTRQYRLARGGLAQPFESLDQALATIRSVRDWRVADAGVVGDARDYHAQIRLRLDTSMLPKPFQVNALTDRDWTLASDWSKVAIAVEPAAAAVGVAPAPGPAGSTAAAGSPAPAGSSGTAGR